MDETYDRQPGATDFSGDVDQSQDPAGLPGAIDKGGEPEQLGGDSGELGRAGRRLGEEGGPVGLRVGRDPGNLGDEIPSEGDVTYPGPGAGGEKPHM